MGLSSASNSSSTVSDSRERLRWTQELHDHFVECVTKLGGPERATPKGILKAMQVPRLTIYHVKSHLQKFRLANFVTESNTRGNLEKKNISELFPNFSATCGAQLTEALLMHAIEEQKRFDDRFEVQKRLKDKLEAQVRYLERFTAKQQNKEKMSFIRNPNNPNQTSKKYIINKSCSISSSTPNSLDCEYTSRPNTIESDSEADPSFETLSTLPSPKRPRFQENCYDLISIGHDDEFLAQNLFFSEGNNLAFYWSNIDNCSSISLPNFLL